jgi:enamine deaminase RidA (YjgF/YER057c/UK114 family)
MRPAIALSSHLTLIVESDSEPSRIAQGMPSSQQRAVIAPLSADAGLHEIFPGTVPSGPKGEFSLARSDRWLTGIARLSLHAGQLERETRTLYADLFEASAGWHLSRVWNYVPGINASGLDGLENYRAFCRGRSVAFENAFGRDFKRRLPAASAVGTGGKELIVAFAASTSEPTHIENPHQVPAYEYPSTYGPRPPSFARASIVSDGALKTVFISGTSAIIGHATVAPFDTHGQLDCTLANLRTIATACGLGATLGAGSAQRRNFRIYLRNPNDCSPIDAVLQAQLLRPGDAVSYVHADICRRELNVEIEATVCGRFP